MGTGSRYVLPWGQMSFWGEIGCPRWLLDIKDVERGLKGEGWVMMFCSVLGGKMRVQSKNRIGPHNRDVISLLVGSMLGDGYGEKRKGGVRFILQKESSNVAYIMWFYKYLAERGYCKEDEPRRERRIGKGGKVRYNYRLRTYTYNSMEWLYDMLYEGRKKVIKEEVGEYMSPLCLGIWIMDDGGKVSAGMKLSTNGFEKEEVEMLSKMLNKKYELKTRLNKAGEGDRVVIYVPKESMRKLAEVVKDVIHPTMKYKLNGY